MNKARQYANLDGGADRRLELLIDDTNRLFAATLSAQEYLSDPEQQTWISLFKQPFTVIKCTNEKYWAWKLRQITLSTEKGPIH